MAVDHTWLGSRGVLAHLHLPDDGRTRGAILVCPSLGHELPWSYRALRLLSERLCASGLAALRFDYTGTGHSSGAAPPGDPDSLVDDTRHAAGYLSSIAPQPLGVVAFGAGALVACAFLARDDQPKAKALALWEPAVSARRWLRHQEALLRLGFQYVIAPPPPAAGEPAQPALRLGDELGGALSGLSLGPTDGIAERTLVACGEDSEKTVRAALAGSGVDWVRAEGTDALLYGYEMPVPTLEAIAGWLGTAFAGCPETETRVPTPQLEATIPEPVSGAQVRERILALGAADLFAVATEPPGPRVAHPVVFINSGIEPCLGPGRLWVKLARQLAAQGRPTFRVDLSGIGDSPERRGQRRDIAYSAEAIDDMVDAASAVSPDDPAATVMVGMCSGGYHVLEFAARIPSSVVCAVNPILDVSTIGDDAVERAVHSRRRPSLEAVQNRRFVSWLRRSMPSRGWWLLHVLGVQRSPASGLQAVVEARSQAVLICGPYEAGQLQRRGRWILERLLRSGYLRLVTLQGLGHSVLSANERELAERELMSILGISGPPSDVEAPAQERPASQPAGRAPDLSSPLS